MKKSKRILSAICAAVLAACVFAGCSVSINGNVISSSDSSSGSSEAQTEAQAETTAAAMTDEVEKGDTGEGPAVLQSKYADFTVPEGMVYEVYTYVKGDGQTGSIIINFGTENKYQASVEISTARMVSSLDDAAKECARMHNTGDNEPEYGDKATYGDMEYQSVKIVTDYNDKDYLTGYYKNGENYDTYIEITRDNKPFGAKPLDFEDEKFKEFINSIAYK